MDPELSVHVSSSPWVYTWRLYITKSAIHYLYHGDLNISPAMWVIPFTDIKEISAVDQYGVDLKMEPDVVYRYLVKPWFRELHNITLTHCENAAQFVEAAKQQMVSTGK